MWYIIGAYMTPGDVPALYWVKQALEANPKGIDTILLVDLNTRLGETCGQREEELATSLAEYGL